MNLEKKNFYGLMFPNLSTGGNFFTNDQTTLDTTRFTITGTNGKVCSINWGDGSVSEVAMDGSSNNYDHDYSSEGTYTVSFSGDLDEITHFTCQETTISGSGSWMFIEFSTTGLVVLNLTGTAITFGTDEVVSYTALTSFIVRSCSNVTGDIADLTPLTSLTSLFLDSSGITDFTDGALPDWDACEIDIANLGITSTEVSNFLIRLDTASSSSTETIDASGTTPAPSATGRAAIYSLVAKGWTITVSDLEEYGSVTQANMKQSLVDGTAFIDIGADISTDYAGLDTGDHDYFIEVYDSAGKMATGWIGAIGGGETLGASLWDAGADVFTSGTYAWAAQGSNTIDNVGNELEITYDNSANGARVDLNDAADLSSDLTVGSLYKIEADSYYTGGAYGTKLRVSDSSSRILSDALTGSKITYTFYLTSLSATGCFINLYAFVSSNVAYIDNLVLKQVTDCSTNGVHIISTVDGSTQNWADVEAGFDYNDSSGYTYFIYAS